MELARAFVQEFVCLLKSEGFAEQAHILSEAGPEVWSLRRGEEAISIEFDEEEREAVVRVEGRNVGEFVRKARESLARKVLETFSPGEGSKD